MGARFFRSVLIPAAWGIFLFGLLAGVSGAATRYRDLERAVEDEGYGASEISQVARAYGAALKAGQDRRDTIDLVKICIEGDFGSRQLVRVLMIYAQLELAELPDEEFVSKVQEGVAKGIPAMKVLAAAERRALMLKSAENILNGLVLEGYDVDDRDREELLPTVAEALESGKGEREVRKILISSLEDGENLRKIRRTLLR